MKVTMKKVLLTATVQSHIVQFHKPLVQMLHEKGYEVHVAARNNLAEKNGLSLDFADRVFDVPFSRSPKSRDNFTAYRMLKQIIADGGYAVVHCNTPMGGIVTRLAAAKVRRQGTAVLYTAHGFHFYRGAPKQNWLVFYPVEKWMSRLTDCLVTITTEDYQLAKEKFHCPVFHLHGVGADSSRFFERSVQEKAALRQRLGFAQDTKIILNVGELLPNKNQAAAVRAVKQVVEQYPNTQLLLAGNGPERANLERLVAELGMESHVTFLGYTTELPAYQNIADVLLACSFREGLPLNVMEAMLCATPVVASNNRGHRELIKEGVTGVLADASDPSAFAAGLTTLLDDPELAQKMGRQGQQAVQPFTDQNVYEELKCLYQIETE